MARRRSGETRSPARPNAYAPSRMDASAPHLRPGAAATPPIEGEGAWVGQDETPRRTEPRKPGVGSIAPAGRLREHGDADRVAQQVKYDPSQAKALLKQAGYVTGQGGIVTKNGPPLQLLLPSSPEADWLTASQVVQQMLKSVGIGSKITTAATQTYYTDVRTGHHAITWWLSNYAAEPPVVLTDMASTNYWNVWHMGAAANAPIDRLLAEGTSTLVHSQRAAIYQQLNNLVTANAYQCPGDWHDTVNGLSSKLHGVVVDPTGMTEMYQKWWLAQ